MHFKFAINIKSQLFVEALLLQETFLHYTLALWDTY